jgi:hypothetical protein
MSLQDFSGGRDNRISSWASNFITLNLDGKDMPEQIAIKKCEHNGKMKMNVFVRLEDGKIKQLYKVTLDKPDLLCQMDLGRMKENGVKELILIITNIDAEYNIGYRILRS